MFWGIWYYMLVNVRDFLNKKATIWALIFIICFWSLPFNASAADVGGADISIGSVKSTTVSVKIDSNNGLMGFKIIITYPIDIIKITSVNRGTVTKSGNFSTNSDTPGRIVVVWFDTSQVTGDGSLFDIMFDVIDNTKSGTIRLSYSEDDTFDQEYKPVILNLKNIGIKGKSVNTSAGKDSVVPAPDEVDDSISSENTKPDYGSYRELIESVLKKYDLNNLTAKQSEDLLNEVNTAFESANREERFKSVDALVFFYEQIKIFEAQEKVESSYTKDEISGAVDEALKNIGAENIAELTDEQKSEFSEQIKELLPNDSAVDKLTDNEITQVYKDYYSEEPSNPESADKKIVLAVTLSAVVVFAALAVIYILIRRRRKNEKS